MAYLKNMFAAGLLLLAFCMPATARQVPAVAAAAPTSGWVPMLWQVKGEGQSQVLLLGSIHLLQPQDYPLPLDVQQAYARADRLVFELAPEQMLSPQLAQAMLGSGVRRSGRLQDELGTEQWRQLSTWAQQQALPLERLQMLKPWFAALTVSLQEMAGAGMQAELGLDRHLMGRGQADGKPMQGLEDGLAQIALFDSMSEQEQRQMLAEALEEAASNGARFQGLLASWRSGEPGAFWAQAGQPLKRDYPALYQAINVQRNQAWLAQLPQWLGEGQGTTLVVVGALHLVGTDGLVQSLQAGGYAVERICSVRGCPRQQRRQGRR